MIIIIEKRKKKNETVERKTAKWLASSSWVDYVAVLSIFMRVRLIVFFVWTAIQFRVFVVDGECVCVRGRRCGDWEKVAVRPKKSNSHKKRKCCTLHRGKERIAHNGWDGDDNAKRLINATIEIVIII